MLNELGLLQNMKELIKISDAKLLYNLIIAKVDILSKSQGTKKEYIY